MSEFVFLYRGGESGLTRRFTNLIKRITGRLQLVIVDLDLKRLTAQPAFVMKYDRGYIPQVTTLD